MIELNAVGWSALLAPPALIGGVAWLALVRPPAVGELGGTSAALSVALAWDRWRWSNSVVSVSGDLELEELRRVVECLRAERINVIYQGPALLPASELKDIGRWRLTKRQPWLNRVLAALDDPSTAHPRLVSVSAASREQVREFHRE